MTDGQGHPVIAVTTDGDTLWLECFEDDPDADNGALICLIEPGSQWFELAAKVDAHIVEHGC